MDFKDAPRTDSFGNTLTREQRWTIVENTMEWGHAVSCQACGRDWYKTAYGRIAHHGFKRPGDGMIHDECPGGQRVPYEVGNDAIDDGILVARNGLEYWESQLKSFASDTPVRPEPFRCRGVNEEPPCLTKEEFAQLPLRVAAWRARLEAAIEEYRKSHLESYRADAPVRYQDPTYIKMELSSRRDGRNMTNKKCDKWRAEVEAAISAYLQANTFGVCHARRRGHIDTQTRNAKAFRGLHAKEKG